MGGFGYVARAQAAAASSKASLMRRAWARFSAHRSARRAPGDFFAGQQQAVGK